MIVVAVTMQEREIAFVIKRFLPLKQKASFLTCSWGRINVIIMQQGLCDRLWPGMMVALDLKNERGRWVAQNVIILSTPEDTDYGCISWLHHVCELCYYFLPAESPCVDVFFYVKRCFLLISRLSLFNQNEQKVIKKIGTMKFLSMVGFYDDAVIRDYLPLFHDITVPSVDFADGLKVEFLKQRLENVEEENMDQWILSCLKNHPLYHVFKTIVFNYRA